MKTKLIMGIGIGIALLAPQMIVLAADQATSGVTTAKVPVTAEDHLALADTYRKQAVTYRQQAADHRAMLDAYKISNPKYPTNLPDDGQWQTWVRKHCRALIADAEKLAADTDKLAELHESRAKALQGK